MKILLAEYAIGAGLGGTYLLEGKCMLETIACSFTRLGHVVVYPSSGVTISSGLPVESSENNFEYILEKLAKECDAGLIIAPDEILSGFTAIVEENTTNLGCSPEAINNCVDKIKCGEILSKSDIPTPEITGELKNGWWVVKPRYGSASENTFITSEKGYKPESGYMATEYINGDHLSVSIICGDNPLPLTVNKQIIDISHESGSEIRYNGNLTPYNTSWKQELYNTAISTSKLLKCRGYIGIDFILNGSTTYVVDVNPRPTTSLVSICNVMKEEIAELLIKNQFGGLPESVEIHGEHSFSKEDLK
ncbi:MAG: ATP-grasp domain-containing protein [Methanohalobium sp.]|uniref:ATP-grasp domain-containing protein n=1 Tax=Methanohalobium sp. TaxID=2837493 RepID=UPI00397E3AF5